MAVKINPNRRSRRDGVRTAFINSRDDYRNNYRDRCALGSTAAAAPSDLRPLSSWENPRRKLRSDSCSIMRTSALRFERLKTASQAPRRGNFDVSLVLSSIGPDSIDRFVGDEGSSRERESQGRDFLQRFNRGGTIVGDASAEISSPVSSTRGDATKSPRDTRTHDATCRGASIPFGPRHPRE